MMRECRTQAELDKAQADKVDDIRLVGDGYFVLKNGRVMALESSRVVALESSRVEARESSRVEARESSRVVALESSRVEARESSRVEAWGSSRVVAWGSSSVEAWGSSRVVARGSSRVVALESSRVVAWGSSSVEAWGSSRVVARGLSRVVALESSSVVASSYCSIHIPSESKANVKGGVQIIIPPIDTAKQWCDYYGVPIHNEIVILFKAVNNKFRSKRGGNYTPGIIPKCDDWDGGKNECGGGLHFVPHPLLGLEFDDTATKFVACPVRLADIVVHYPAEYPNKIKAPHGCAPCWEVDRWGDKINVPKA